MSAITNLLLVICKKDI